MPATTVTGISVINLWLAQSQPYARNVLASLSFRDTVLSYRGDAIGRIVALRGGTAVLVSEPATHGTQIVRQYTARALDPHCRKHLYRFALPRIDADVWPADGVPMLEFSHARARHDGNVRFLIQCYLDVAQYTNAGSSVYRRPSHDKVSRGKCARIVEELRDYESAFELPSDFVGRWIQSFSRNKNAVVLGELWESGNT